MPNDQGPDRFRYEQARLRDFEAVQGRGTPKNFMFHLGRVLQLAARVAGICVVLALIVISLVTKYF